MNLPWVLLNKVSPLQKCDYITHLWVLVVKTKRNVQHKNQHLFLQAALPRRMYGPTWLDKSSTFHSWPVHCGGSHTTDKANVSPQTCHFGGRLPLMDLETPQTSCCLQNSPTTPKRWRQLNACTLVVVIVFLNEGAFWQLCCCLFIRGSCESYYWSAPCRYASKGYCGKSAPLGYMCHHRRTRCQRRWNSGEDNKALKIWESRTRCKHFFFGRISINEYQVCLYCFSHVGF